MNDEVCSNLDGASEDECLKLHIYLNFPQFAYLDYVCVRAFCQINL
jgi:hypothetical protein